nr:probable RNA-dependent RNA polymerase 5 [Tanacetum cinerariifolium]
MWARCCRPGKSPGKRRKLEDVVSVQDAIDIISMKIGPMFDFEAKILAKYGRANCEPSDRGLFVNTRRTHLQRELGNDNVLIVQFTDHLDPDMPFDQQSWIAARQTISDRISIGVRHYSLFEEITRSQRRSIKKSRSLYAVKCYFMRTKSHAPWLEKDFISFNKKMHENIVKKPVKKFNFKKCNEAMKVLARMTQEM